MAMTLLYTLILGATLVVFAEGQIYPLTCDAARAASEISPRCGQYIKFGLNDVEIQGILDAFSSIRRQYLTWSINLALQAQARLNQCNDMGNSCFQYSGRSLSILHSSNDIQSPAYIIQSAEQARRNGEIAAENARKEARALQNLLRNQQNAIEREAQRAVAEAQNMAANLRNSFAVNFPPNFPFNGASRPPFDFYNQGSWYRSKRTAGNDVGCGFLVRNVYGNMEHKLLCYFG